jgi:hypothetical protein
MFVGIGNAAVVFFLVFILRRVRSGIAAQPELLDKLESCLKADNSSSVMM